MPSPVDICNRALSEIGSQSNISTLADPTPEAFNCSLVYTPMRQALLRAAHWGFARASIVLTQLQTLVNTPTTGASPYPYLYEYAYPSDCLKVRYVLNQPFQGTGAQNFVNVSDPFTGQFWMPSRKNRFIVGTDMVSGERTRVIFTNVQAAVGVYTADMVDPDMWDPLFTEALVVLIASKIVIPLTGNVGEKTSFAQLAQAKIDIARASDGNEARPTTDHTPDWITARGFPYDYYVSGFPQWGNWWGSWDNMSWGE